MDVHAAVDNSVDQASALSELSGHQMHFSPIRANEKEGCEQNANLQIYMLAWDHSGIYAAEREWLQRLKLNFTTQERVHFEYFFHVEAGGSFHHKYAVIDALDDALARSFTAHDTLIKKTIIRRFGQRLGVFDIDSE